MNKTYGIKNASLTMFNKVTGEKVLEAAPLTENEYENVYKSNFNHKPELIPFTMKFDENFEATIYVDQDTANRFYELGKKQSK